MNEENYIQNMIKKYQKLKEALMEVGPIQQGTILPRTIQKKNHQRTGKNENLWTLPSMDTKNQRENSYKQPYIFSGWNL